MTDVEKKMRADTQRTRNKLLDVLGRLLEEQGLDVSLPELAKEAGVATATVYRHFDDVHELRVGFYQRIIVTMLGQMSTLSEEYEGLPLYEALCRTWVQVGSTWARAATFIRSAEGYLERVKADDPMVAGLDSVLRPVLARLIEDAVIPDQDLDYAVLVWVTLFDERVFVDLEASLGWKPDRIATTLSATVLAALRA